MSKDTLRAKDLSELWNVSTRRINQLCQNGDIPGAYKEGKFWIIPNDVSKPSVVREKEFTYETKNQLLPCPIGITSFKEVSKECYYVDKTLFIKDIIDDKNKVYLFTRPRRFGKTLMMDMLRVFFEKTKEDTSQYFVDKDIWNTRDVYKSYQAKYPTIFLTFKDTILSNWQDMYKSLCFIIRNEYLRHIELLDSLNLNEYDRKYFLRIVEDRADYTEYQFALEKLSSMLSRHYQEKVIVIIDEYDTPIQQGYIHGYYQEVILFMRNLFSAVLKDNENLEFGILSGILRIAKESLFSGLNNLVVNTILDEKYDEYFGFTFKEVKTMAKYYQKTRKLLEIKEWYDGYQFGNVEIYNPWSVISYFNNNENPKAFWSRTSGNEIIGKLMNSANEETQKNLIDLLQGKEVQALIDTDIIYPEVNGDSDILFSFLLVTGYLKVTRVISEFNDNPICSLKIPNREVKSIFQKEIIGNHRNVFQGSLLRDFELAIRLKDSDLLTRTLQKYLMNSASFFDVYQENFYHGVVLGMLAVLSQEYYILSNRESGNGRFDIELEPKDKTKMGYIIEFKVEKNSSEESLSSLAESAIEQMEKNLYYMDMKNKDISTIGLFGIAFCGKQVVTKYKQISL